MMVKRQSKLKGHMMEIIPVIYKCVWVIIFCAVVVIFGRFVLTQINPPKKILVSFNGQSGESLVSRWQSLINPVRLQNFFEIATPDLPDVFSATNKDMIEEFKLTIKGVEIHSLISSLRTLLNPPSYDISIKIASEGTKKQLEMNLKGGGKPLASWFRSSEGADAEELLKDFALFQLLYYLYYDANGPETWRKSYKPQTDFPNPQALASYYLGLNQLDSYLQSHAQKNLESAITCFKTLRTEMPGFADGLMLLGVALAENREEEEAAKVFSLASRKYEDKKKELVGGPEIKKAQTELDICQTKLWMATAYRKQYGPISNHRAFTVLNELITRLDDNKLRLEGPWNDFIAEQGESDERQQKFILARGYLTYTRLLAQAHVELADTLGSYVIYAKRHAPDRLMSYFKEESTPEELRFHDFMACIISLEKMHKMHLDEAYKNSMELEAFLQYRARGQAEKAELISQILGVEGYVLYRFAAWTSIDDNDYLKRCKEANDKLESADATRPEHYVTLQNLGTVLADHIYDPDGYRLGMAKKCFQQSIQLKPNDYFGYEMMARVLARDVELHGVDKVDKIDDGIENAAKAIALRPAAVGSIH